MIAQLFHMQLMQATHHVRILEREVHVVGQMHTGNDGYFVAVIRQLLGQTWCHEVGIGVENHHTLADLLLAFEDLLGCQLVRQRGIGTGDRCV